MPCHIKVAEAKLAHARISSMIGSSTLDFVHKVLWDDFACLIVLGKGIKELFLAEEVLVELAWQLYEVAWYVRSVLRSVLALSEHTMQAVTKLVEESLYLII